jgi:hypothetical protein
MIPFNAGSLRPAYLYAPDRDTARPATNVRILSQLLASERLVLEEKRRTIEELPRYHRDTVNGCAIPPARLLMDG